MQSEISAAIISQVINKDFRQDRDSIAITVSGQFWAIKLTRGGCTNRSRVEWGKVIHGASHYVACSQKCLMELYIVCFTTQNYFHKLKLSESSFVKVIMSKGSFRGPSVIGLQLS